MNAHHFSNRINGTNMFFAISNKVEQTLCNVFVPCFTLATKLKLYSCNIENRSRKTTLTVGMIFGQADVMTNVGRLIKLKKYLTKSLMISRMKQTVNSVIF